MFIRKKHLKELEAKIYNNFITCCECKHLIESWHAEEVKITGCGHNLVDKYCPRCKPEWDEEQVLDNKTKYYKNRVEINKKLK